MKKNIILSSFDSVKINCMLYKPSNPKFSTEYVFEEYSMKPIPFTNQKNE